MTMDLISGSLPFDVQSWYDVLRLGVDAISNTLDFPVVFKHSGGYHYSSIV